MCLDQLECPNTCHFKLDNASIFTDVLMHCNTCTSFSDSDHISMLLIIYFIKQYVNFCLFIYVDYFPY